MYISRKAWFYFQSVYHDVTKPSFHRPKSSCWHTNASKQFVFNKFLMIVSKLKLFPGQGVLLRHSQHKQNSSFWTNSWCKFELFKYMCTSINTPNTSEIVHFEIFLDENNRTFQIYVYLKKTLIVFRKCLSSCLETKLSQSEKFWLTLQHKLNSSFSATSWWLFRN